MAWPDPLAAGTQSSEAEPDGFGDAVEAAVLMLALMTALAWVGFQWQRNAEDAAHRFAVDVVERIARRGEDALLPDWSGFGRGPTSANARQTFRALQALGELGPAAAGRCRVASRFALCRGTRYSCSVSAATPAGSVDATVGLCRADADVPYTFDTFDLRLPMVGDDRGNRDAVDVGRDGLIRYGTAPLPPDALPVRLHRRAPPWP